MIKISHRGNTAGPNPDKENSVEYILAAIDKGFDVEIDTWFDGEKLYFGHDGPKYLVDKEFLHEIKDRAWFHCKNLDALYLMKCQKIPKFFWHDQDDFALTSNGFIWTFPGKPYGDKSIVVDLSPDATIKYPEIFAICGDYLE